VKRFSLLLVAATCFGQSTPDTFLRLRDTPSSYASQALKFVRVNAAANALEFTSATGGGATVFTGLGDVPASYTGASLKTVRVNAGETALEFVTSTTGATSTLGLTDVFGSHGTNGQILIWDTGTSKYVPGDPIVSGPAAEGAAPVNNPVWVAGKGADGFIHSVRTANDGTVRVDPSGTTTQPVSGTFWQATQPVSGTFWQATQPVSGTFWQATQPVSISGNQAVNQAQVAGTTVDTNSGTKSAGTQRVVIATDQPQLTNKILVTPDSVALPANQSVNVNQVAGTAADTNSGNKSSGTLRVVLATDQPALTNKLLVTPDSVALPANQSVNVNQFGGSAVVTGTGASGAGVPRVTVSNDSAPTLTKGTQGSVGYSTQDLKDAGRTAVIYYATAAASGTTGTETAITLTKASGTSATSTGTSFVITSGKRYRIQQLLVSAVGHATGTTQATTFAFRINTAGAVTTTSTPVVWKGRVQTPATSLAYQQISFPIPDGYEILGDGTLQFGITANAVFTTNAPTWDVTIVGFEY